MTLVDQIASELEARLSVVALLGDDVGHAALDRAVTVPAEWAQLLADPASAGRIASYFSRAVWPHGAPVAWWGTELGRRRAATGLDPGGEVSTRQAADLLGMPLRAVRHKLGSNSIALRDVLDLLS